MGKNYFLCEQNRSIHHTPMQLGEATLKAGEKGMFQLRRGREEKG